MTKKRFTRKSYSIWDNVENKEFYELHYRYEVDDMCRILNNYEEKVKSLEKENEQLKTKIRELKGELDGKIVGMNVFNAENTALMEENEQLKRELKEYKQPNCKKCIEYSQDGVGDYCMSEKGLLGSAWKMFPFGWDYSNAKDCKEYEE